MMSQRKCWTACSANSALASSSSQKHSSNVVGTLGSCAHLLDESVATSTANSNEDIQFLLMMCSSQCQTFIFLQPPVT